MRRDPGLPPGVGLWCLPMSTGVEHLARKVRRAVRLEGSC